MRKNIAAAIALALAGCAAQQPAPPSPSPAPVQPAAPPAPVPDHFTGLDAAELRALAGAPAFSRKDGATEMWRYDTASCRAFFFFTGTPPKVQHVETLPKGRDSDADPACLNALHAKPS